MAEVTAVERDVSGVVLAQGEARTLVVLAEKGDEALLGAVALQILGWC